MALSNSFRHSTHFSYWVYPIFSMYECNGGRPISLGTPPVILDLERQTEAETEVAGVLQLGTHDGGLVR